jgi:hypothetical protein
MKCAWCGVRIDPEVPSCPRCGGPNSDSLELPRLSPSMASMLPSEPRAEPRDGEYWWRHVYGHAAIHARDDEKPLTKSKDV